jgi:hypothetical protein
MGHLTLISEDIVTAFSHYPPDLLSVLSEFVPRPDWDDYVSGSYRETKNKDTSLLGGGRPVLGGGPGPLLGQGIDHSAPGFANVQGGNRAIVIDSPISPGRQDTADSGNRQVCVGADLSQVSTTYFSFVSSLLVISFSRSQLMDRSRHHHHQIRPAMKMTSQVGSVKITSYPATLTLASLPTHPLIQDITQPTDLT